MGELLEKIGVECDIKGELAHATELFEKRVAELREKHFITGKGLILVNRSTERETKVGFLINYSDLKRKSIS